MQSLCDDVIYIICHKLTKKDICNMSQTSLFFNKILSRFDWKFYFLKSFDKDIESLYQNIIIDKKFVLTLGNFFKKETNYKIHQQFIQYRKILSFIDNNVIIEIRMNKSDRKLVIDIDDIYWLFSPKGSKMYQTLRFDTWKNTFMKYITNGHFYTSIEITASDKTHIF